MVGASVTFGGEEMRAGFWWGNLEGKIQCGRPRRR